MSETMIIALISAGGTLLVSIITLLANAFIDRLRSKLEMQQKMYQSKRDYLNNVYKQLISIVNLYPKSSPNDLLKYIDYAPNYSMESFDSVIKSLDYKKKDYIKQLSNENIDFHRKSNIETQIFNIEYSIKKIHKNKNMYFNAKHTYNSFCELDKAVFDLYAGQDVKNNLVKFEVMIHNIFISGQCVGTDAENPLTNCIEMCRRDLINSMRYDIGID